MPKYQIRETEYGYRVFRKVWWWPFWYSYSGTHVDFETCEDAVRWAQKKDKRKAAPKNRWTFPPNVPLTWSEQLKRGTTLPTSGQERKSARHSHSK